MACPLFLPSSLLAGFTAEVMPLGDLYNGVCAVAPAETLPLALLRHCCNTGYGRGTCPRAAQTENDAVRFLLRKDRGEAVDIAWSLERNHHPVAVGVIEVPVDGPSGDTPLARQAQAYAAAYFRHIGKPAKHA